MRKRNLLSLGLVLVISLAVVPACRHQYVGCKQFENLSDEATYCRIHREAVWDYIEVTDTPAGQEGRTWSMIRLLRQLDQCRDIDCVTTEIAADSIANGFAELFANSHSQAESKLNGSSPNRYKIVMCGLENGVRDWVDSLKLEVDFDD